MLSFRKQPLTILDATDTFLLLFLTSLSIISRFWILNNPDAVVFDEVHFGNFTNWYTESEFFYDIHPPLGKLVMFFFANLSEYDGSIDFNKQYAKPYKNHQYIILRITPAIFSSLCAPLIYLSLRFDSFSCYGAFVSSIMLIADTSLLTEQRYILSDGMLLFFTCLFLCVFSYTNSLSPLSLRWILFMLLSGFTLGCACSSKNTAMGLMAYSGFIQIFINYQYFGLKSMIAVLIIIVRAGLLIIPLFFVYFACFFIHFILLPFDGQGTPYLVNDMQRQLIKREQLPISLWFYRLVSPGLISRTILLSLDMHHGNMGITSFHDSQSRPINWPLLTGNYVAFYRSRNAEVNCMGNAFVYYISFFSLILNLLCINFQKWDISLRYIIGWCVSYFPFYLVPRSMFLYHYLIPLIFACCSTGALVDRCPKRLLVGIFGVIISILCLFGFYLWSPYSYGIPHLESDITIWSSNWISGDEFHRQLRKNQPKS